MSLPKELLDQLLSGYLDDALTADERVRVEQLLQSNAEIADELDQLRDLRRSLQVLSRVDADVQLDKGFADRVLGSAVARAREEGMGDEHPLIRLAEQPSTNLRPAVADVSSWRVAAVMVGLAASIAIAVFWLRPQSQGDLDRIAQTDPTQIEQPEAPAVPETGRDDGDIQAEALLVERNAEPVDDLANNGSETANHSDPVSVDPAESVRPDAGTAPAESIAAAESPARSPATESSVSNLPDLTTKLGVILVVEVERTESGRVSDAVANAMQVAGIAATSRKEVSGEIAGILPDTDDASEDVSVLYLQLPGKQFDLFYQHLWQDEDGIASVRMTIALNAPAVEVMVNSVRPDPTTVRHEAAAYELFSQGGLVDQMASELSQLPFPPQPQVDRSIPASSLLGSGPDIQARVLVVVR